MTQSDRDIIGRRIGRQKKKPKGTVKIESDKGWLRLRFTYGGKRRAFALGLPDTTINRKFAEQEIIEFDPWKPLIKRVKVPPKQKPQPFTSKEIKAIIQGFEQDKYYSHYLEFVEFLLGTGCRTGEAIGLCWKHLNEDCSTVWIGESLSRGLRKSTKTNQARTITLTSRLQSLLLLMKCENCDLNQPVFTSSRGNPIDDHNFRNRAWKSVLSKVGVEYRKPYNTRHTLISHALNQGMNPVEVAQLTGHNVQTLYENYAGNVNSRPMLPELLE